MLTRKCRALDCPRHVAREVLFCDPHFRQIPPRLAAPVRLNREVPIKATRTDARKIINGTAAAVAYLARGEGRASVLTQVQNQAASQPVTGTVNDGSTGSPAAGAGDSGGSAAPPSGGSTSPTVSPAGGGGVSSGVQQ